MPGLTIERAATAAELRAAGWDDLAGPGDLYLSADWLRLLETLQVGRPGYLLGRDARSSRLVAGLACYRLEAASTASPFTRLDRFLLALPAIPGAIDHAEAEERAASLLPTLLCGGRQIGLSRLLTAPAEPGRRPERVARMIAAAEELARGQGARSLAFLYVEGDDVALRTELAAAGFRELPSYGNHVLDVRWADFDGYLATLSGQRRHAVRRERRRLRNAGVDVSVRRLEQEDVPVLVELEAALAGRHGSARSRAQLRASLDAIAGRMPERSLLVLARHGGVARGFALFIRWQNELYARHTGFDYAFQGKLPLYFEVLFYEVAARAPALGLSRVYYGVTSGQAKLSRGCRPVPQLACVRALDPGAEAALTVLAPPGE